MGQVKYISSELWVGVLELQFVAERFWRQTLPVDLENAQLKTFIHYHQ